MEILPRRLLFIASIGNPAPYQKTRHSAGHLLLDALKPLLETTMPNTGLYHETWQSPAYMNESGPKLVRRLEQWASERANRLERIANVTAARSSSTNLPQTYPTTLIILHDELSIAQGKVRVIRGGPESFSLRGHRGLISICETLRKKGLYPRSSAAKSVSGPLADLSILRIGLGIGRPTSHDTKAVSDYVLKTVTDNELKAYHAAAMPVVGTIRDELFRPAGKV
ncbi:Peptidyl-tRNA hydrolase [Penicillium cf. griseofulvum]|uniref:Peptidyl-tRNA hydrolase n=1 Tax=Penicillium cf. griseofulvum TaxID=2972120 RepID=A0A9W9JB27_9EURO|nr:Peptidyl-tRNA hydrolase [Penicillium cf. griseofulvum]KAJ5445047.1 Peptidyl-tRNA hydrolase [Penicillium cf. griseofulvum]KAJ5446766.1 Peptidyl-tRNA hydrolase [Penicillium cf. griseofulvum]